MNRPKVIAWLLEHRDYWELSQMDLVNKMQEAKLISRKTHFMDVKTKKLIHEAKLACGEAKPRVDPAVHKHWHNCECGRTFECYTMNCPYPKEARCEICFRGEISPGPKECLFEERPLRCSNCGAMIGDLGTCADTAFCGRCEKLLNGKSAWKGRFRDAIYVPTSGSDSRRIKSKVH